MKVRLFHEGEALELDVDGDLEKREIRVGELRLEISEIASGSSTRAVLVDGHPVRYLVHRTPERIRIAVRGESFDFDLTGEAKSRRSSRGTADPQTRSPMPGKVLQVLAQVGAVVKPGDSLLILEAMKMENVLTAEVSGKVVEIHVRPGDMVEPGKILVVIQPEV